jgi:hypothetical protein
MAMADLGPGPFVGHGYRILLGQQYAEDTAQAMTNTNYQATNGGRKRAEPTVGSLVANGWGQLLQETLVQAGTPGAMSDVLGNLAYNLGANGQGGTTWLVPVGTYYTPGGYRPQYRRVDVWVDTASLEAAEAQAQAYSAQQAAQAALQAAQSAAQTAATQNEAAIALGKAGQGLHPFELTVSEDGMAVQTATTPQESRGGTAHPGKSIIDDGMWEVLYGTRTPASLGLPRALLATDDGGKTIHAAVEEYNSLRTAAMQGGSGFFQGLEQDIFGRSFGGAGQYTPGQVRMAQQALQSLGLPWQ